MVESTFTNFIYQEQEAIYGLIFWDEETQEASLSPREETELSEKQILSQICPSNSFLKLVNRFISPLFFSPWV